MDCKLQKSYTSQEFIIIKRGANSKLQLQKKNINQSLITSNNIS